MKKTILLITAMVCVGISVESFAHDPIGACYIRVVAHNSDIGVGAGVGVPMDDDGILGININISFRPGETVTRDFCFELTGFSCRERSQQLNGEVKMWRQDTRCPESLTMR